MDPKLFITTYFAGGIFILTAIVTFFVGRDGLNGFNILFARIDLGKAAGLVAIAPVLGFLIGTLHLVLRRFLVRLYWWAKTDPDIRRGCWNIHDDGFRVDLKKFILKSADKENDATGLEKISPDTFLSLFTFKDFPKELSEWRRRLNGAQLAAINNVIAVWLGLSLSSVLIYFNGTLGGFNPEGFFVLLLFAFLFMALFCIQAVRCYWEERHLYELIFYFLRSE